LSGDPFRVRAAVQQGLVGLDPKGFASTPSGRTVTGILRGTPRWRTPRIDLEFAGAFELGLAGRLGIAFWSGAKQLRASRAPMAAHVRYLFDFAVAPQGRWPDARRQREATGLWLLTRWARMAEPGRVLTRRGIALWLRRSNLDDYAGESEAVTIARIYRISAALRRAQP
jgi:hypothetical protein